MDEYPTDAHYYSPQTEYNNTLAGYAKQPDGVLEKRMKVLRAYATRGQQSEERKENVIKRVASESRIRPTDRFKYHRQGKFNHPKTALFDKSGQKPKGDYSDWWKKELTVPGEAMNAGQRRCSSLDSFTGSVAHNYRHHKAMANYRTTGSYDIEEGASSFGDQTFKFIDKSNVSKADAHSSVRRQADFLAEATFRNSLRDFSK